MKATFTPDKMCYVGKGLSMEEAKNSLNYQKTIFWFAEGFLITAFCFPPILWWAFACLIPINPGVAMFVIPLVLIGLIYRLFVIFRYLYDRFYLRRHRQELEVYAIYLSRGRFFDQGIFNYPVLPSPDGWDDVAVRLRYYVPFRFQRNKLIGKADYLYMKVALVKGKGVAYLIDAVKQ